MSKRSSEANHSAAVGYVALVLEKDYDYTDVCVDLDMDSFDTPEQIDMPGFDRGGVPDVTGYHEGRQHIFEVETPDSIRDEHTSHQWRLFAKYADENNATFLWLCPRRKRKKRGNAWNS